LAGTLPGIRNFSVAVTEEEGSVGFLHRIVPGGADKSYGVHVAQLAGLPQGVINRAWEVLADLEGNDGAGKGTRGRRPRRTPARQMPLFDTAQPLVDEIRALDIPNMTPLEAINVLYQLQKTARDHGEAE
jgi:DNA mismatch repair protein MutS